MDLDIWKKVGGILIHKIFVKLILSFPSLTRLIRVEPILYSLITFFMKQNDQALTKVDNRNFIQRYVYNSGKSVTRIHDEEQKKKEVPCHLLSQNCHQARLVNKKMKRQRLKKNPRGEDYQHLKHYFPDKDIEENIPTKDSVPSNLLRVKP